MVDRLITWYHTLTWEKGVLFLAQWLVVLSFLLFLSFSTDFLSSFSFLRNSIFRCVTAILFFLYLILFCLNRSYRPRINSTLIVLFLLFITLSLSALVNGTLLISFWGDYLRMDGLFSFGHYLVFVLVVSSIFRTFNDWQKFFQFFIFISFVTALVAFSQELQHPLLIEASGGSRASSTFGNVSYYGFFQTLAFFFCLYVALHYRLKQQSFLLWFFVIADLALIGLEIYLYVNDLPTGALLTLVGNLYLLLIWIWPQFWLLRYRLEHKPWQRWLALSSILVLQLAAIWFSGARSSILATAVGLIVVTISFIWLKFVRLVPAKVFLLGWGLVIVTVGIFLQLNWQNVIKLAIRWEYTSFIDRLAVWDVSWQAFLAKPFIGWGPENYSLAFNEHYNDQVFRSGVSPIWYDRAHNIFIQYLVEGGAVAVVLYLLLWLLIIRSFVHLWRQRPAEKTSWIVLGVFWVVYIIQGWFYFDTINNLLIFFFTLAYMWSREAEITDTVKQYGLPLRVPFGRPIFFLLLGIITVLFIFNFYGRSIWSNHRFTSQLMTIGPDIRSATASQLDDLRQEADKAPTLGKSELRYQYVLLISDLIKRGSNIDKDSFKLQLAATESVMLKNISKKPKQAETYLQLLNYYLLAGRIDPVYWERGLILAQGLRYENPRRTQLLYVEGQMRLVLGQVEEGLELFRQATLQRPDIIDTHVQYYKQLSNVGQLEKANEYFDSYLSNALHPDILAITQYDLAVGHVDLAVKHLDIIRQRKKIPHEVAVLSSLILLAQGQSDQALVSARQAVEQYPSTLPTLLPYFPSLQP